MLQIFVLHLTITVAAADSCSLLDVMIFWWSSIASGVDVACLQPLP